MNLSTTNQGKQPILVMMGCFDTKAEEFHYLYQRLSIYNYSIITINTGALDQTQLFPVDYENTQVAHAAGLDLNEIIATGERTLALEKMAEGSAKILAELSKTFQIVGLIGMGGGGGTYLFLKAVQQIPFGIPKVCLSTLATKDLSEGIGGKDIVLLPSIVDVAGLNEISRVMINQAAGALNGMIQMPMVQPQSFKGKVAISIFGNTTLCVNHCTTLLKEEGYEVYTFHAVGSGGRTMESLIMDGFFDAVLDITTTELADNLCGGICSAGPNRLSAAGIKGIPQVVVPGCLDMVNFGSKASVPAQYQNRLLYSWAPDVTLMRTNADENARLGEEIAHKLNQAKGPVRLLLPLQGISMVSKPDQVFYQPEIDQVLFEKLKEKVNKNIPIIDIDENVNTEAFAEVAVNHLLEIL